MHQNEESYIILLRLSAHIVNHLPPEMCGGVIPFVQAKLLEGAGVETVVLLMS